MAKPNKNISSFVIERLAWYLLHLETNKNGKEWISSHEIAKALDLTSSTVRQDLSYIDYVGTSKKGYETEKLKETISRILSVDKNKKSIIIGAGNFGKALALHKEFRQQGFDIIGIFDSEKNIIGKKIGSLTIQAVSEIPKTIKIKSVDIGIIAVPASAAQEIADLLINSGIKGLLSLATPFIQVPPNIPLVNSRLIINLMQLSYLIKKGRDK